MTRTPYTPAELETINALRLAGTPWLAIARAVGRQDGKRVLEAAKYHALPCMSYKPPPPEPQITERERAGALPLPAGHPLAVAVLRGALRMAL